MLDFYVDWCVFCKEMECFIFIDVCVKECFGQMLLLQIDVIVNNVDDCVMLKCFNFFGLFGIMFFDVDGWELVQCCVIGYQDVDRFIFML